MPERILVVEDEHDIRSEIVELLREEGFDVVEAADGEQALHKLRGGPRPCLILLDLMLPRVDGWTFRAEQMKDPLLADIPVVVLSGARDLAAQTGGLAVAAYLSKPFETDQLLSMVRTYC